MSLDVILSLPMHPNAVSPADFSSLTILDAAACAFCKVWRGEPSSEAVAKGILAEILGSPSHISEIALVNWYQVRAPPVPEYLTIPFGMLGKSLACAFNDGSILSLSAG